MTATRVSKDGTWADFACESIDNGAQWESVQVVKGTKWTKRMILPLPKQAITYDEWKRQAHVCDFNHESKANVERCSICSRYWQHIGQSSVWQLINRGDRRSMRRGRVIHSRYLTKQRDQHKSVWSDHDRQTSRRKATRSRKAMALASSEPATRADAANGLAG